MNDFAIREKLLRLEHDYTMQDVADGTGLTPSAVSRYESGKREPNARVLSYFCKFYNVSADWFLGLVGGRNEKYGDPSTWQDETFVIKKKGNDIQVEVKKK